MKVCVLAVQHGVQPLPLLFSQAPWCTIQSCLRHLNQTHIVCLTSSTNTCPYPDVSHPLLTDHHSSDVITMAFYTQNPSSAWTITILLPLCLLLYNSLPPSLQGSVDQIPGCSYILLCIPLYKVQYLTVSHSE